MTLLGTLALHGLDAALKGAIAAASAQAIQQTFEQLRAEEVMQFATEGDYFGHPWPPAKRPAAHPLMIASGRLLESLTSRDSPEHVEEILAGEGSQLTGLFGTKVPYARFHQHGKSLEDTVSVGAPLVGVEGLQPFGLADTGKPVVAQAYPSTLGGRG